MSINFDMGDVPALTTPIADIPQDTTGLYHDSSKDPGFKKGDIYTVVSKKGPLFVYDPQKMKGPYQAPVKVLSELVIKAPVN